MEECDSPDRPVAPSAPACCPVCGGCCRQAWCCETTASLQGAGYRIRGCVRERGGGRGKVHRIWVLVCLGFYSENTQSIKEENDLKWFHLRVFSSLRRSLLLFMESESFWAIFVCMFTDTFCKYALVFSILQNSVSGFAKSIIMVLMLFQKLFNVMISIN